MKITVFQNHTSKRRVYWLLKGYKLSICLAANLLLFSRPKKLSSRVAFSRNSYLSYTLEAFQLKDRIKATSHLPNDAVEQSVFALSSQRVQISLATANIFLSQTQHYLVYAGTKLGCKRGTYFVNLEARLYCQGTVLLSTAVNRSALGQPFLMS